MTKVICDINCGNSPRAAMLRDFNIAFATCDADAILAQFSDNIRWEMMGSKVLEGKAAVVAALPQMTAESAEELEIKSIVTHGASAACDGTMTFADGTKIGFCDVYEFTSAAASGKIKAMRSYGVDL
jgi:hypothetical protein